MFDTAKARASGEIVLESFHLRSRTFRQSFDASIIQVLHITDNLMTRGRALRKETKADSLHITADNEPARNS